MPGTKLWKLKNNKIGPVSQGVVLTSDHDVLARLLQLFIRYKYSLRLAGSTSGVASKDDYSFFI